MRKEIYKIKNPKHIVFGDPLYFEDFKGAELKRLTVDYKPPKFLRRGPACPAGRSRMRNTPNTQTGR